MDGAFTVEQFQAGYCMSYVLAEAGEAILIDPHITRCREYRDHLAQAQLTLKAIVDTHTHADHLSAAALLAGEFGCPVVMSSNAVSSLGPRQVGAGDTISFGGASLDVMPAPGHTDDSIALIGEGAVFTGDVLLIGSVGRTDFQNGSPEDMFGTLAKLKELPDATVVWPAHDYKGHTQSTIGQEKAGNPFMMEGDRDAFAATARSKKLAKPFNMDAIIEANREGAAREIETISVEEGRRRLESTEESWRLLDVRRPEEYRAVRIEQSLNIPLDSLASRLAEVVGSEARLILSCRSGARATTAANILMAAGERQVTVMRESMIGWEKAKYPVIRERVPVSLERQVRAIAGSLVLIGTLLAIFVSPWFLAIPLFVAGGLLFAGVTDSCMMGMLLMKLPYNRKAMAPPAVGGTCSLDGGGCSMDAGGDTGGGCSM